MEKYIDNWQDNLPNFWVPIIIGIIFIGLAIKAIKDRNIMYLIIYVVLALCCFCYTAFGDSILSRLHD